MRRRILLVATLAGALGLLARGLAPIGLEWGLEGPLGDGRFELELADVDLELLRGGAVFEGIALRGVTGDEASLRCERLRLRIAWRDLLERRVRVRAVEIDAPQLTIRRGPDGGIALLELLDDRGEPGARQSARKAPPEDGSAGETERWSFAVDRLALDEGQLRFRDLSLSEPGRWSADLDELVVRRLSFEPGVYAEPGELHLEAELEGAPLSLSARFAVAGDGRRIQADLDLSDLPMRKTRLYLEGAGWTGVRGRVDASLQYVLEAERHDVTGAFELRELAIRTPEDEEPALAWSSLSMASIRADLRARELSIGDLRLAGGRLRVDAGGRPELPILPAGAGTGDGEVEEGNSASVVGTGEEDEGAWQLAVAEIRIDDSEIRVRPDAADGAAEPADDLAIGLRAEARDLSLRAGSAEPFPLHVELAAGSGEATARFDGRLGLAPLRGAGDLEWQGLDLPRLARAFGPESLSDLLRAGRSRGRVRVEIDAGTTLEGELALEALRLEETAQPDTPPCGLAWRALEVPVEELFLPWPEAGAKGSPPEARLRLGALRWVGPEIRVRRDPQRIGCPIWSHDTPDAETAAPWSLAIEGERIDVEGGRVTFVDRAVEPFVEVELADVSGFARSLRATPELSVARLELQASGADAERVELEGSWAPTKWKVDAVAKRLDLPSLNPYTHRYTPFFARDGEASVSLRSRRRAERIDTDIDLVLHDLRLESEERDAFRKRYGLPLPVAMALLRDVRGDIALDLPISRRADAKTELDVGALVYGALRRSLVNAMTAPLKLLGAVVTRDEEIEAFEPEPILFEPGRAALSDQGRQQLARLAEVLVGRPLLAARLEPRLGASDLAALGAASPVAPGAADRDDEMAESAPETPEALAAARVAAVVGRLRQRHGVGLDRMQVRLPAASEPTGMSRVELALVPLPAAEDRPVEEFLEAEAGGAPAPPTPPPAESSS